MALPVPVIVSGNAEGIDRTKFMADGMGFDRFVATWPITLPPVPRDLLNSGDAADPWRQGDNAAVASILYRVIENRSLIEAYGVWDATTDYPAGAQVSYEGLNYTATGNPDVGDVPGTAAEWGAGIAILGVLPNDVLSAIIDDTEQRETVWVEVQGMTDFRYQDAVFSGVDVDASTGRHSAMMPTLDGRWAIDATAKCYWVTAWLGKDAGSILIGYNLP